MRTYLQKCDLQAILELSEKGVLDELEEKWMKPKVCPDDSELRAGGTAPQLNIMSFRGLYYMLFVFAALSLLWTAVEHVSLAAMSRSAPLHAANCLPCIHTFQGLLGRCTVSSSLQGTSEKETPQSQVLAMEASIHKAAQGTALILANTLRRYQPNTSLSRTDL